MIKLKILHPKKLKTMYRIFAWPLCKDGKFTDTKSKKDYTTYGTSEDKANGKRYILGAKRQRKISKNE